MKHGIDVDEFKDKVGAQNDKKIKVMRDLQGRMAGSP
jgi:hypothetical protein